MWQLSCKTELDLTQGDSRVQVSFFARQTLRLLSNVSIKNNKSQSFASSLGFKTAEQNAKLYKPLGLVLGTWLICVSVMVVIDITL